MRLSQDNRVNAKSAGAAQHLRMPHSYDIPPATKLQNGGCQRSWPGYKNKTRVSTNPVNIYAGQHGAGPKGLLKSSESPLKTAHKNIEKSVNKFEYFLEFFKHEIELVKIKKTF